MHSCRSGDAQEHHTSFHRFLINWVKLSWHEMLRDTLFKIIDEQWQSTLRNRCRSCPLRNKLLEQLFKTSAQERRRLRRRSRAEALGGRQESLQRDFFEQFLSQVGTEGPIEVRWRRRKGWMCGGLMNWPVRSWSALHSLHH